MAPDAMDAVKPYEEPPTQVTTPSPEQRERLRALLVAARVEQDVVAQALHVLDEVGVPLLLKALGSA